MRNRKKKLSAVRVVKEMARERLGPPRPQRVVPDRKKKTAQSVKHKPTLADFLREDD